MLESLSNKVAGLKKGNFIKKRLQHSCFPMNTERFLRTAFFIEHLWWLFLSVWWTKFSVVGICRHSLLNSKHNLGKLLLKVVVDLVRVCPLQIIGRNHSKKFLLINLQKRKTCPKWSIAVRVISSNVKILTV